MHKIVFADASVEDWERAHPDYREERYEAAGLVAPPHHVQVNMNGIPIDTGIAPFIQWIWDQGFQTVACCQGNVWDVAHSVWRDGAIVRAIARVGYGNAVLMGAETALHLIDLLDLPWLLGGPWFVDGFPERSMIEWAGAMTPALVARVHELQEQQ